METFRPTVLPLPSTVQPPFSDLPYGQWTKQSIYDSLFTILVSTTFTKFLTTVTDILLITQFSQILYFISDKLTHM